MNKQLIKRIEEIFEEKISVKTGWGKNEIMVQFKEAVSEACLEIIDNGQLTIDNEKPEWLTDLRYSGINILLKSQHVQMQ